MRDAPAAMREFTYTDLLPTGADDTEYRRLDAGGVSERQTFGGKFLELDPGVLPVLTRAAMRDIAHPLRPGPLRHLRSIPGDPQASPNDRDAAPDLRKEPARRAP